MIKKYAILIVFYLYMVSAQNKCCNGPKNILGKGKCIDKQNITGISCAKKYLLEAGLTDGFVINENGNLQDGSTIISQNGYCISKLAEDGPDVALVCFPNEGNLLNESPASYTFRAVCCIISVLFLIATVIVYALVPDLRDLQGKCLLHSICCLALAMLLLASIQLNLKLPDQLCHITGHIIFALFLATFAWLNVISFHVWRTIVRPDMLGTNKQWYLMYCIYGYGISGLMILVSIIAHHAPGNHIKPRIGETTCFFSTRESTWAYFYGPIAFLLILNIVFFCLTIKKLWKDSKNCKSFSKLKSLKYKCLLYVKLFIIMGLAWIFEVFSFAFQNYNKILDYIWLGTDFINAIQGVLIFLVLVPFRKRVLRGLANRGFSCIPQQWKTLDDEECERTLEEEQLAKVTVSGKVNDSDNNKDLK